MFASKINILKVTGGEDFFGVFWCPDVFSGGTGRYCLPPADLLESRFWREIPANIFNDNGLEEVDCFALRIASAAPLGSGWEVLLPPGFGPPISSRSKSQS